MKGEGIAAKEGAATMGSVMGGAAIVGSAPDKDSTSDVGSAAVRSATAH